MRDGHLWGNVFAVNEGRAARPDVAVEPEVAALAMGYDDENDMIERCGWGGYLVWERNTNGVFVS